MKRRGFVALLIALIFDPLRSVALAICNPALVRLQQKSRRQLVQVRPGKSPQLGHYFVQWYGHSSFLIHSGSQTKVVADPNFNVTPGIRADAVTVSNDHFTHNNTGAVTGDPVILRGITFRQTWNPIRTSVKDITIINIPSQRGQSWGGAANSIFIYEMGSLCLAHLGNIGHLLTPEQEKVLQRVDVMMVPIDAMTNLGFDDILKVIEQVKGEDGVLAASPTMPTGTAPDNLPEPAVDRDPARGGLGRRRSRRSEASTIRRPAAAHRAMLQKLKQPLWLLEG